MKSSPNSGRNQLQSAMNKFGVKERESGSENLRSPSSSFLGSVPKDGHSCDVLIPSRRKTALKSPRLLKRYVALGSSRQVQFEDQPNPSLPEQTRVLASSVRKRSNAKVLKRSASDGGEQPSPMRNMAENCGLPRSPSPRRQGGRKVLRRSASDGEEPVSTTGKCGRKILTRSAPDAGEPVSAKQSKRNGVPSTPSLRRSASYGAEQSPSKSLGAPSVSTSSIDQITPRRQIEHNRKPPKRSASEGVGRSSPMRKQLLSTCGGLQSKAVAQLVNLHAGVTGDSKVSPVPSNGKLSPRFESKKPKHVTMSTTSKETPEEENQHPRKQSPSHSKITNGMQNAFDNAFRLVEKEIERAKYDSQLAAHWLLSALDQDDQEEEKCSDDILSKVKLHDFRHHRARLLQVLEKLDNLTDLATDRGEMGEMACQACIQRILCSSSAGPDPLLSDKHSSVDDMHEFLLHEWTNGTFQAQARALLDDLL